MRRVAGGLLLMIALGSFPARADSVWTCEQDGRIGGRASALCITDVEPGSYRLTVRGLTRESSGELHVTIGEQLQTCTVIANVWSCENGTQGVGPAEAWPIFDLDLDEPTTIRFRTYPPECGTVTCSREPQIITGRFRITLDRV